MVMLEALSREERRVSVAEADVVGMALGKPSSSSSSFSILESLLDLALARLVPRHMEVEMGEAFMATVDSKELEMMMVMLKPLDELPSSTRSGRCREHLMPLDVETEMVHMDG